MNIAARDIRARLMNPPVKLTREAIAEKDEKIRELRNIITAQRADIAVRQETIDRLTVELRESRKAEEEYRRKSRAISEADNAIGADGLRSWKAIVKEVMSEFPGVSWAQIKSSRRQTWIVACRRACVRAVHAERPEMTSTDLAKLFNKEHSTIQTILGKRK
ncbi:hypothetical protein HJA85_27145 [Rhizobium bangladeshense]|uniref:hypothetical protein n=1 Tax=Rhizobium TaxID=379 RepID=UPI001A937DBE|nr:MULTISPECIES: hypothetical protein [Rhizobium]MBX4870601.1 hypothetical protein [Rhizobium bangladeshense]MBX4872684.1 hypothetical protein [Rhizobium bangladeshense]MBX5063301.1 hypothetical protein [Rhizobium lentis]MBX5075406.1 hypothetical protein [Rhizobium lentis]QSW93061.1 hypothetical protein J0663_18615 [Rhizobium lentis]